MTDPRYLLDTNILSALIKHPAGAVADRIRGVGEAAVATSIVVACELRYGAAKKSSARLTEKIDQLLSRMKLLPLDEDADRHYAKIRNHLYRTGRPIGPNDLLIAAHALSLGLTLITDNVREFTRVPGLVVENWVQVER